MTHRHQKHLTKLAARFRGDSGGAAAVEFALIAMPFLGLLFAIVQTSIAMFATQALQTMVTDVSRRIMTGQAAGLTLTEFRKSLCGNTYKIMFNCDNVQVQVKSYANFATANPATFYDANCFKADAPATCFSPGNAKDVVLVRVAYQWPLGINLQDLDRKQTLVAVNVFRNEAY